jgi:hypothetical protein
MTKKAIQVNKIPIKINNFVILKLVLKGFSMNLYEIKEIIKIKKMI